MDYASLASVAISAISPFVKKGIEKLAEKSAEEGFRERKVIWEKVKGLFRADDLTFLNILEEAAGDSKTQDQLEGRLETHLKANPRLAEELMELLEKIDLSGRAIDNTRQTGNQNIVMRDIHNSNIKIG